jgi:hypothetical protein
MEVCNRASAFRPAAAKAGVGHNHNAPMPPLDLTDDEHATKQKHGTPPMTTPQWVAAGFAMVLLSLVVVSCEASIWHECRTAGHSWLYCARIFVK